MTDVSAECERFQRARHDAHLYFSPGFQSDMVTDDHGHMKKRRRHTQKNRTDNETTHRLVLQRQNVSADPAVVVSGSPSAHTPAGSGFRRTSDPEHGRCLRLHASGGEPCCGLVRPRLVGGGVVSAEEEIRPASRGCGVEVAAELLVAWLLTRGGRGSPARLAV